MKRYVDPDVFVHAAEMVDAQLGGCCSAIMVAGRQGQDGAECRFFNEWFRPDGASTNVFWWNSPRWQENREPRVLALLFAAILAEEEFS
jgi:hypothetical protein